MADDPVASFMGITGATEEQAAQMLEATNFSLQDAVELYFAAGADAGLAAAPAAQPAAGPRMQDDDDDDEALARRLQQEANAAPPPALEEVRAPLPTRTERLYGDEFAGHPRPRRLATNPVPANALDAFRDFRAEGEGGSSGGGSNRLASMFEPPRDIIFMGSFEDAKQTAASQGHWLIINLQSTTQFASHQLNRDTWRDGTLKALVQSNFVLLQVYDVTEEGQKLANFYDVLEVPTIVIVDPVTGAPMKKWTGFVEASRLGEDLMPFMDTSFTDPGASRLAASLKRKMQASPARQPSGHFAPAPRPSPGPALAPEFLTEEELMQQVLAASAAEAAGGAAAAMDEEEEEVMIDAGPPAASGPSPEQVAAEAEARLPKEVAGPEGCRIAVRFADGACIQRRFPLQAPLRSIHDWCLTRSAEAAGGRAFLLSEAMPGAPPLTDLDASLEAVGVANSTLVMKWTD